MPNGQVVRQPLRSRPRPRRAVDERLAIRFPALARANARVIARLAPDSRVRRAVARRGAELALAAYNRRDAEAVLANARPDVEYRPERSWVEGGLVEESYRGLDGYRRYLATSDEVWEGDNHLEPLEVIDMGGRVVILAVARMRAQSSGVPLVQEFALVVEQASGQMVSGQEYYDHAAALAAVGLAQ